MSNRQDGIKSMPNATTADRCAKLDATIAVLREFDGCEVQGRKIDAAAEEAKMELAKTDLQCGQAMECQSLNEHCRQELVRAGG